MQAKIAISIYNFDLIVNLFIMIKLINPNGLLYMKKYAEKGTNQISLNLISKKCFTMHINYDQDEYFKEYIEMRSDVKTIPTKKMLEKVLKCHYGDDCYGEDPTMNKLLKKLCELFKKEAALFVPSGTMGNMVSLLINAKRGDYIIQGKKSHIYNSELESQKLLGFNNLVTPLLDPVNFSALKVDQDHETIFNDFDLEKIISDKKRELFCDKLKDKNFSHYEEELAKIKKPKIIAFENTHNYNGGLVLHMDYVRNKILPYKEIYKRKDQNLIFHLDGSRVLNASVATKIPVDELSKDFETVNICLSKGFGAPCGSVIFMENKNYEKAEFFRKSLGGGMRQNGVLAAQALVCLEDYKERFENDHSNAKLLSEGINTIKGLFSPIPQTNIVNVFLDKKYFNDINYTNGFVKYLEKNHKLLSHDMENAKYIRCVLHHQITKEQTILAIKAFEEASKYFNSKR